MNLQRARKTRRHVAAVLLGVAVLLASACGGGAGTAGGNETIGAAPASARKEENKLVLASLQDPGTLDYVSNNLTALIQWIPGNVVEPLITFDADQQPQPSVAESWEVSEDLTSYTFTIREASFSNGAPVTAADVVYSLTTMQNSPVATYAAPYEAVESITATDERTVAVELSRPSQSFLTGMGGMSGLIQPEAAAGQIATAPIGTGPYVLDSYVQDSEMTFSANPTYWGEAPHIPEVEVKIISDGSAALNAMRAGEVDVIPVLTIDLWERLAVEGYADAFQLITYPQVGEMLFVAFNSTVAPYDDVELRRTLAKTFDRQQFVDAFAAPWGAIATCGFGLDDTPWFEEASAETCPTPADPDAAAAELAASPHAGETLDFTSLSDVPDLSLPADLLIAQLHGAGAEVERDPLELARYSQLIFQGRPPQFGITVMSDPSPITQFACTDPAEAGWTTYCSPEMTDLMNRADAATSQEEYEALMARANQVLAEDAVIVPLLAKSGVGLLHPDLQGWQEPRVKAEIRFANLHW